MCLGKRQLHWAGTVLVTYSPEEGSPYERGRLSSELACEAGI